MFYIRGFINQWGRVLRVASRPRQKEFEKIVKVTAAGVIVIGAIGVILSFVLSFIE